MARPLRRALWVVALVGLSFAAASAALAQDRVATKFRSGSEVTVTRDETVDDLYATAGMVVVDGHVTGDLYAAGGDVDVRGDVEQDLVVAAGRVTVHGAVGGDVRAAGGNLTLDGPVAEDAVVAGGTIDLGPRAEIGGDLVFAGGNVAVAGNVDGDVLGSTGSYKRTGTVGGSEDVTISRPREEAVPTARDRVLGALRRYVTVLVLGALLLWLAPRLVDVAGRELRERPLPAAGAGVLTALGFVLSLVALVLATVLASIVLDLANLGGLATLLAIAAILVALVTTFLFVVAVAFVVDAVVGATLGRALGVGGPSRGALLGAVALGAAIIVAVTALPVVGGWLRVVVVLLGLGALVLGVRRLRSAPAHAAPPVV